MENQRQKTKSIKNQIKHFILFFNFIKSETSDSFVNHFDGHFAYLKTLDFYFKQRLPATGCLACLLVSGGVGSSAPLSLFSMLRKKSNAHQLTDT